MSFLQKKLYDRLSDRFDELKKIRQPWEKPCDNIIDVFRPDITTFERKSDNKIELLGEFMFEMTPAWAARSSTGAGASVSSTDTDEGP